MKPAAHKVRIFWRLAYKYHELGKRETGEIFRGHAEMLACSHPEHATLFLVVREHTKLSEKAPLDWWL
jgi:hypothetical protein